MREGTTAWWNAISRALSLSLIGDKCPHCKGETMFGDYWTDEKAQRAVVIRCRTCGHNEHVVSQPAGQQGVTWHRLDLMKVLQ